MESLKLTSLEKERLSNKEMNQIVGGAVRYCTCACYYADNDGSSIEANGNANFDIGPGGGHSEHGPIKFIRERRTLDPCETD